MVHNRTPSNGAKILHLLPLRSLAALQQIRPNTQAILIPVYQAIELLKMNCIRIRDIFDIKIIYKNTYEWAQSVYRLNDGCFSAYITR